MRETAFPLGWSVLPCPHCGVAQPVLRFALFDGPPRAGQVEAPSRGQVGVCEFCQKKLRLDARGARIVEHWSARDGVRWLRDRTNPSIALPEGGAGRDLGALRALVTTLSELIKPGRAAAEPGMIAGAAVGVAGALPVALGLRWAGYGLPFGGWLGGLLWPCAAAAVCGALLVGWLYARASAETRALRCIAGAVLRFPELDFAALRDIAIERRATKLVRLLDRVEQRLPELMNARDKIIAGDDSDGVRL